MPNSLAFSDLTKTKKNTWQITTPELSPAIQQLNANMKNISILLVGMKLKRAKFLWKEEKKKVPTTWLTFFPKNYQWKKDAYIKNWLYLH